MDGMDQDGLRFEGNCTLKLPKTSTHCTGCFATIAAFQDKVCCTIECKVSIAHCIPSLGLISSPRQACSAPTGSAPLTKVSSAKARCANYTFY